MSRFRHSLTIALAFSLISCAPDPAERAYLAALRRRPELIYPLEARARAHERLHEEAPATEDRAKYERLSKDSGCALCVDPFRY